MEEQVKAYGDAAMSRTQIYEILKRVKEGQDMTDTRGKIGNRTTRTPQLIAEVKAVVEVDRRVDLSELAAEFYTGLATVFTRRLFCVE